MRLSCNPDGAQRHPGPTPGFAAPNPGYRLRPARRPVISPIYQPAAAVSIGCRRRGSLDDAGNRGILARLARQAGKDDLASLDDVEPIGEVGNMVDVGFGNENGAAARPDPGDA